MWKKNARPLWPLKEDAGTGPEKPTERRRSCASERGWGMSRELVATAKWGTPEELFDAMRHVRATVQEQIGAAAMMLKYADDHGWEVPTDLWSRRDQEFMRDLYTERTLPEVFNAFGGGKLRRRIARLPIAVQRRLLDNPVVPVLCVRGSESTELQVKVTELSEEQVDIVFDAGKIRNPAAQRRHLEEMCTREAVRGSMEQRDAAYDIDQKRGRLVVHRPVTLNRTELQIILAKMS